MLKYCDNCGHELEKGEKICNNCGKHFYNNSSNQILKTISIILFLVILGICIFWFTNGFKSIINFFDEPTATMHEVVKATKKDDFILESSELVEEDFGAHYIVGTIKNNTNKTYNYVQVTFNLYDSQENQNR